jgi:hypothetical protein
VAKKKKADKPEHYEWVKAVVYADGECRITYRVKGARVVGSDVIDEDVSRWTQDQIISRVKSIIDVEDGDPVEIQVEYE